MTIEAHIENGQVVLPSPLPLPDGTRVTVAALPASRQGKQSGEEPAPTLHDRMKSVIGIAEGLPSDASINVDHYLYGHPKQ